MQRASQPFIHYTWQHNWLPNTLTLDYCPICSLLDKSVINTEVRIDCTEVMSTIYVLLTSNSNDVLVLPDQIRNDWCNPATGMIYKFQGP